MRSRRRCGRRSRASPTCWRWPTCATAPAGSIGACRDLPRLKLSRDALIEEYGNPEIVNALPKTVPPLVTEKGGARPGEIAELLGFSDGRAMIDALTALAKEQAALRAAGDKRSVRQSRVDAEVARVMKERHGDMLTDGSIEAEALSALHNDARSDVLATELRALARQTGQEPTPYALARNGPSRSIAEKQVGQVSDLSQYTRAEAKAAKARRRGPAEGRPRRGPAPQAGADDRPCAVDGGPRRQGRSRDRAQDDGSAGGARTIKSMDQGYLEKIHDLLERFDLKARSCGRSSAAKACASGPISSRPPASTWRCRRSCWMRPTRPPIAG
jgi:hypothetical protein